MELVQVRIRGIVSTGPYGTLQTGDVLRTDAAFARHLVEDCAAAEYVQTPQEAPQADQPTIEQKPKRGRKSKEQA